MYWVALWNAFLRVPAEVKYMAVGRVGVNTVHISAGFRISLIGTFSAHTGRIKDASAAHFTVPARLHVAAGLESCSQTLLPPLWCEINTMLRLVYDLKEV